jgi:hypothetical protein
VVAGDGVDPLRSLVGEVEATSHLPRRLANCFNFEQKSSGVATMENGTDALPHTSSFEDEDDGDEHYDYVEMFARALDRLRTPSNPNLCFFYKTI